MSKYLRCEAVVGPKRLPATRAVTQSGPALVSRFQLDGVLEILAGACAGEVESHGGECPGGRQSAGVVRIEREPEICVLKAERRASIVLFCLCFFVVLR